ncbi:MAG TPA: iron donor protein CyaY [Bryobacteraceae bacterium]|jgi:CyaY protein|nr:iron donor protein CyaY [Bryobacteraceae bacterium]
MIDEQTFRKHAEQAIEQLQRTLENAMDRYEFEVDSNQGALTIEFEDPPARFVVSPNAPVRQIWVSARVKSFKLDWDEARNAFALGGKDLKELIAGVIGEQLEEEVTL